MAAFTIKEGQGIIDKCGLGYKFLTGTFAFDSSYPTGGEACDLSYYFPKDVHMVAFEPKSGFIFQYDYTNKKVLAYYADYNATADGALIQVPNTTDLSALADVRFFAVGK